jgi:parallel beta-helix repeat protein
MQNRLIKNGLVLGVVVLFIGLIVFPVSGNLLLRKNSNSIFNSNTLYVGGGGPGNYSKIQDAIDNTSDGDTVFVYDDSSPYYENIQINKSINLIGEDRNTTVIDATGSNNNIDIMSDAVNINGFTLQNPNKYGIESCIFGFCTFTDNIIINTFGGIRISSSCNNTMKGNTFFNYELYGIDLWSSDNNTISGNYFGNLSGRNFNWGITLTKSKGNNISYNTFKENMIGIGFDQSAGNYILNNIISFNLEAGIRIGESSNNTFIGNIISNCLDYGFLIYTADSKNNIIFHNNFKYNGENANDKGNNTWDDGFPSGGNFWDGYTGEDNNGDGIGDTPYLIPGGDNEDRFPLVFPWGEPRAPIINGPSGGKPGVEICFTFNSTDPDDDEVKYIINWGDGTIVETGYNPSGIPVEVFHTWNKKETFVILATAVDIYGYMGDWSMFEVKIIRDKTITNSLLLRFLEKYPLLNQFIQRLTI